MKQYLDLAQDVLINGEPTTDRTGVGTIARAGYLGRFPVSKEAFPLLTTKRVHTNSIIHELLWFIRGDTSLQPLLKAGVRIWNEWPFRWYLKANGIPEAEANSPEWKAAMKKYTDKVLVDDNFAKNYGNLGPIYGKQWRAWETCKGETIDQLQEALKMINSSPDSRRIIVSAWNPADIEEMTKAGLPPCHCFFQFHVINGKLSLELYQRSCDVFLGVPFNIASYALLLLMVAQVTNLEPHELIWVGGNVHIYSNHIEQIQRQLVRIPTQLPRIELNPNVTNLFDFTFDDIKIRDYNPAPYIKGLIAV